ncbi:MAG: FtsX-like permease family protein, partial [Burkholderiales bacterium]
FFRAVQVEKNVMFVILTLIVAVAAFNIVSTLVMAVADKRADIAILRTLGAAPASIRRIFVIQGSLIGIIGALIGLAAGVVLALNVGSIVPAIERVLGARFFDPNVYYITSLPSELRMTDVLSVAVIAFVLSIAATLYPSYRAAQINPAEALRYE